MRIFEMINMLYMILSDIDIGMLSNTDIDIGMLSNTDIDIDILSDTETSSRVCMLRAMRDVCTRDVCAMRVYYEYDVHNISKTDLKARFSCFNAIKIESNRFILKLKNNVLK